MATYTDDRNWDQKELDEARATAADNVVTPGSSVPNASRLRNTKLDSEEPSPVLKGERPTTEDERESVDARGVGANVPSNGANEDASAGGESGTGKANFENNNVDGNSDADSDANRRES